MKLARFFRFGVVGDASDSQLLQQYLTGRDGAEQVAFSALVERHGPMVIRVCRQVLGNHHDSHDAFQATFLVLARKAGSVRNRESLASWLHGIALRVAMRAKVDEARRRAHERRFAAIRERECDDKAVRPQPIAELHEEIARLPQRFREPLVLCYLEGLTSEQAAARIGCPAGTFWSRLSTAHERLRGRLVRRGMALTTALLAAEVASPASAALSQSLLDATVRASLDFVGRHTTEAVMASQMTITLARGVLYAMTISELKALGAATVACALALGGASALTLGQAIGQRERQERSVPEVDDRYTALGRSVDKLESELDESARRNAEMRKDLQTMRAELKGLRDGPKPRAATEPAAQFASVLEPPSVQAVARFVKQLKRHPVQPKEAPDRVGIYLIDLGSGEVTLIADQPAPGLSRCGSAVWSHDGRRILHDATPGTDWSLTRLLSIEQGEGQPTVTDLGPGNCPTFSPADDRIFFLSNVGAESGVWMMKADGSDRRPFGDYGKPTWSPDGQQLMIMSFGAPRQVTLMDSNPARSGVLQLSGHQIYSHPSWAGKETIIAGIGVTENDTIALIDVSDAPQAKVKEVLWRRADGPDVEPAYPIYSAATDRCIFVGKAASEMALYSVPRHKTGPAKPLQLKEHHALIADPAYSPDGRYIVYSAMGPGPAQ